MHNSLRSSYLFLGEHYLVPFWKGGRFTRMFIRELLELFTAYIAEITSSSHTSVQVSHSVA